MRVLFHGAGASASAGYPLVGGLLGRMSEEIESGVVSVNTSEAWSAFCEFREAFDGPLARLLANPNPEIVLTVPDLLDAGYSEEIRDLWARLGAAGRRGDAAEIERVNAGFDEPKPDFFSTADRARRGFVGALTHCLGIWHWRDLKSPEPRSYLHDHLARLDPGDIIITTNWDTLLERTLLEQGRWSPADGWGTPFEIVDAHDPKRELPAAVSAESAIRVLKLHGSYGWAFGNGFTNGITKIHLRHTMFLQALPVTTDTGEQVWLRDANEPRQPSGPSMMAAIYPTYLKGVVGEQTQRIWYEATRAVAVADDMEIIGSSLPRADVSTHTLLAPLRYRIAQGLVRVAVRNPDRQSRRAWEGLLGEGVEFDERPLGPPGA